MESEKKINWLSLFIRVVIIFIFILIIIWLISKIFGGNKLSDTFTNNIKNMETVSVNYFKTIDLPLEKGQSIKITLEELINKQLILVDSRGSVSSCDKKESYSEIKRDKTSYLVTTKLKCGKEEDTIKKTFSLKDCRNCNAGSSNTTNNSNNSQNGNTGSNEENSLKKVTYYEYVKETTSYTEWMRGPKTGSNIENRYEYYGIDYETYYTVGALRKGEKSVTYTLKLDKVPNEKYYFMEIEEVNNFDTMEEVKLLDSKSVSVFKGDVIDISSLKDISKYSLKEPNFTYKLSPYYRKGSFYIDIKITVDNLDNIMPYKDNKIKKDVYLIPLKIKVKFSSDQITSTKPEGLYETIPYYRYIIVNKDTIWSTESYVEGYTKTGRTREE